MSDWADKQMSTQKAVFLQKSFWKHSHWPLVAFGWKTELRSFFDLCFILSMVFDSDFGELAG